MPDRYWLVHSNGGRQLIDPSDFDLNHLAEQVRGVGGRLVIEAVASSSPGEPFGRPFEAPISALGPLFRGRLARVYDCRAGFEVDINIRPTNRVLGGYYKTRRLVRVYSHDRATRAVARWRSCSTPSSTRSPITSNTPSLFLSTPEACGRVPGRMHSQLFWRILGESESPLGRPAAWEA